MNQVITEILQETGYHDSNAFLADWSLMIALSKISQYQSECDFFFTKYRMPFGDFEKMIRKQNEENFDHEADLEDWEFAWHALAWWEKRIRGLQHGYSPS
ncbi:MAG: hypothetical protein B6242_10815 [Anaerolineaceae bacterium 4572_78]|nr:MAG: hypothetical protein B6242_10815 [Anaerolineaceae bacterium 4572_78]